MTIRARNRKAKVEIIEGPLKGKKCTIRSIVNNVLFLYDANSIGTYGIIIGRPRSVEILGKELISNGSHQATPFNSKLINR